MSDDARVDLELLLERLSNNYPLDAKESELLLRYVRTLEDCVARMHPDGAAGFGMSIRYAVEADQVEQRLGPWLSSKGGAWR